MSVDDMLWWLYDQYQLVVGTRTIRRVFERKGDKTKKSKGSRESGVAGDDNDDKDDEEEEEEDDAAPQIDTGSPTQSRIQYQSPYAPMAQQASSAAEQQLAHALQQQQSTPQQEHRSHFAPPIAMDEDLQEDEETIQLQLQQIELQKREVELKLKMRRLQQNSGRSAKSSPVVNRTVAVRKSSGTSSLYNPNASTPTAPKRDSRSKKKIEESKRRTAERQERMLRDLERRSRRRDHLTSEWVQSKDIWPLRAQGLLADLMHQFGCYTFAQNNSDTFENMYRELYQLVDLQKGDWIPQIHDEMLRERMKRKMGQLRTKMQKTGEIVTRTDGYGGFQKADNYTGEEAGGAMDDESEMMTEMSAHELQGGADMQAQAGAPPMQDEQMHYEPGPDHQQMAAQALPYGMMSNQGPPQYPLMDQMHGMPPYHINGQMGGQMGGQMNGNQGVMGL